MRLLISISIFLVMFLTIIIYESTSGDTTRNVVDMYQDQHLIISKCVDGEKIIIIQKDKHFQGMHVGKCKGGI